MAPCLRKRPQPQPSLALTFVATSERTSSPGKYANPGLSSLLQPPKTQNDGETGSLRFLLRLAEATSSSKSTCCIVAGGRERRGQGIAERSEKLFPCRITGKNEAQRRHNNRLKLLEDPGRCRVSPLKANTCLPIGH